MKFSCSGVALAAAFLLSGSALADSVVGSGVFALSGTVTGTPTGLDFYLNSPGDQIGVLFQPTLGAFASCPGTMCAGTQEVIQNLTAANGVAPGSPFDFVNWIQLTDGINLDATSIPIDSAIPVCTGTAFDSPGDQCRPNATSPVILTQGGNGVSARLEVDGWAHFAGSATETAFVGLFNAPATRFATISSLVTAYDADGGIPDVSYTAQFTTTAVPEPVSLALVGLGLLGLGLSGKKLAHIRKA
jgi:hypothetical protein